MPPAWIRRPVAITIWLVVGLLGVLLSPVVLSAGALASAITRRPQPLLLARLLVAYFPRAVATLCACGALWMVSGCGWYLRSARFERLHWRLLRWYVGRLSARALELFDIRVMAEHPPEVLDALEADRPLIVFSRHAGPGDTVLLIDQLLSRHQRRPSVVLKREVVAEPCVDLLAHRLPHAVLDTSEPDEAKLQIRSLAGNLEARSVLVLFPEGANFSYERRRRALASLRRKGEHSAAARAQRMPHLLPPRPSGAIAALQGNPEAQVIFAAHTGLGLAAFPRQIWRDPPIARQLRMRMWLVQPQEIPDGQEARVAWLNDWWERIDVWISACEEPHEAPETVPDRGDAQVRSGGRARSPR